jgi:hypothetical protein
MIRKPPMASAAFDYMREQSWDIAFAFLGKRMAVLNETGEWTKFQMDLGDRGHRRAFLAGEVPEGVVRGG